MPLLLTFGDSNTHGTLPIPTQDAPRERLGPDARWPGVCLAALGERWSLVEAGLPGRTLTRPDPVMGPHMDGRVGLFIALESCGPIDVMTLMLGTNDCKAHFGLTSEEIARDAGLLLDICLSDEMQDRHGGFEVLLIAPPPVAEAGSLAEDFLGGEARGAALAGLYLAEADARQVAFLDAGEVCSVSRIDGVHFGAEAHDALGRAVAARVAGLA